MTLIALMPQRKEVPQGEIRVSKAREIITPINQEITHYISRTSLSMGLTMPQAVDPSVNSKNREMLKNLYQEQMQHLAKINLLHSIRLH
jgi:hypothetical protein